MRTPDGRECRFYYEDFHRGRSIQTCRLLEQTASARLWQPRLCATCPAPAILRANACPNMKLSAQVGRRWLVMRQVRVSAFCTLSQAPVAEPMVGCGRCHEDLGEWVAAGPE